MTKIKIASLKELTGVGFGTSGIRDLNEKLTDKTVYIYTLAFLKLVSENSVAIAGDRRFSTDKIMRAVSKAVVDSGKTVINCGKIPTPAVTFYGMQNKMPSIMITGSHIPEDRNGVKFALSSGEILKSDEQRISLVEVDYDEILFNQSENFVETYELPIETKDAYDLYLNRYTDFFNHDLLLDKVIGVYGHSAVGRDLMCELCGKLGAAVIKLEYSDDKFIPVDTDNVNEELILKMKKWSHDFKLDYIISTDGDGDRPLMADEEGNCIRSELLPVFAGKYLGIQAISTTLMSCTVVDKCGYFEKVLKTKVGSPMVIEGMLFLANQGFESVAGYELNGGFLTQTDVIINNNILISLPTRDAILPILATIALAIQQKCRVSELVLRLPKRFTYSSSIKGIPTDNSLAILDNWEIYKTDIENTYGKIVDVNLLDGLRLTFENDDIVHFRPSKNAPEFRNYIESDTYENAKILSGKAIVLIQNWTKN